MATQRTLRLTVDASALNSPASQAALGHAAAILREGGTVAFPTETVYGLGANALDSRAVRKIFEAKQRPAWDPLIVHIANDEHLRRVAAGAPSAARQLMDAFWPGPLTLLLPKASALPEMVTAGRPRVGVRMPSHSVARRLIELADLPIAAPSANSFGRTSPTRAEFVLDDLDGRIDAVIDSGQTTLGLESTVVDVGVHPPLLYRPGMVTLEQLQAFCPEIVPYRGVQEPSTEPAAQASPGTGLKHYAPKARLILIEPGEIKNLFCRAREFEAQGEVVGIMLPDGMTPSSDKGIDISRIYHWGEWEDHGALARRLFSGLRELDALGATVILCPLPEERGIGAALRDRLLKAARRG